MSQKLIRIVHKQHVFRETIIEKISRDFDINSRKCGLIKSCIDNFLSTRKSFNLQRIALKTSVPYSTLRRITNLESSPRPESVIKILNFLGADQTLRNYMTEFHPDIANLMNNNFTHNQEYTYIEDKNRDLFSNENYFLILNLASTRSGTSRDEVSYQLGIVGLDRLDHLVEIGLVIEDTKGRYYGSTQDFKLSFAETKKRIEMSLQHYRIEEAGSIHNWMSFQTESVNEDGLKALKKLNQKHFNERKDQIYNNPMYNGDIKAYTASISSTFLPYTENEGLQ